MESQLHVILTEAQSVIAESQSFSQLQDLRVKYLGKKSDFTELMKQLGQLSPEDRPKAGQLINDAKSRIQALLTTRENQFKATELNAKLTSEKIDVTLPGRGQQKIGSLHPVTQVRERVTQLFSQMGFTVAEGPEIEDEYHNFSALNFVDHHPAKEAQDTFYFGDGRLLRTHTSPVQIREMQRSKVPIRLIALGRVYRRDSDQTHTPMFHQVEGLVIEKHCTFTDLKGLLQQFLNHFFEEDLTIRFRPSFFPFTEPSAEVDIYKPATDSWLEVLGCGMVHPNVLKEAGVDPDEYCGYAFGIGLDRLAMLRYHIPDLRLLFENDLRFLQQF